MPRAQRLRRSADFAAVERDGRRQHDRFFAVTVLARLGNARLGLAVSRRVSGKAVTRNRIKRQIRESFRMHRTMLQGLDIVVVARPAAAAADNAALARALQTHWERLARR